MNTGYNTDVRHGEVVFHVQTEDKGLGNPFIESLVYVGGQVLASKRASYAELLAEGKEDKEIVAFMDHQHRTMIAAIRHGKLDAKLASLAAGRQTGASRCSPETPRAGMAAVDPAAGAGAGRAGCRRRRLPPACRRRPRTPLPAPAVWPPARPWRARSVGGETVARPLAAVAAPRR